MAFAIKRPIEQHQQEAIDEINQIASDKITSKYPIYKQINIQRTNIEDLTAMNTYIDTVRDLAQTAKKAVKVGTTITAIKTVVSNLVSSLESIV